MLPLCGAHVVLGVQWLRSLGPVLTDYTSLSMKFMHQGCIIEFQGDDTSTLQPLTSNQVRRLVRTAGATVYFHLSVIPLDTSDTPNPRHFTTLSLKFIFQSLITLHMNHTLESRCNNTHQFHNKQLASVMQQLY